MKSPYNTRPYRLPVDAAAETRRRLMMLYVAMFSGPIGFVVVLAAIFMIGR